MPNILERASRITGKGQTTIPKPVRDALGVGYGGRIVFRVDASGVSVRSAEEDNDDPVLESFLNFLAADMHRRPEAIVPISPKLARRIAELTGPEKVDPDEEIEGAVDL